jgi:hypothetical protein
MFYPALFIILAFSALIALGIALAITALVFALVARKRAQMPTARAGFPGEGL